jgi:transposase
MYYVGIDWADQKYDLMMVDDRGTVCAELFTVKKNYAAFEQLGHRLRTFSPQPQDIKIGIETPHNIIVDFLMDRDYVVLALFPGAMKSLRKRYRASGARDDRFDAFVLADVLRTDTRCWRQVDFGSDLVREIRLMVQDYHAVVEAHTALTNQLGATLKTYYPEYHQFFNDIACPSSLAFIQAYPDFNAAHQLTREQLAAFFKEQKLRNNQKVTKIYTMLQRPPLPVSPILIRTKQLKARGTLQQLFALAPTLEHYEQRLEQLLRQHPDSPMFLSYPGVGALTAARLLAFFGDNRELYADVSELQALAGTCPVTDKSGNYKAIYYRTACNKFFRDVMHDLAFSSLRRAKWALAYYHHHRQRGKTNQHALRCLANIHLRILFAMWKTRTNYDENIFLAQRARMLI